MIPARDAAPTLARTLDALKLGRRVPREVIVVDDASRDDTASVARERGARVVTLPERRGPAIARNAGADHASGTIVLFLDADVVPSLDLVAGVEALFDADPELTGVFGSYDRRPEAENLVSQFRNLWHHFVHQQGAREATSFWAGCGALRLSAFRESGGFARRYSVPSIEDIELGRRLTRAGARIRLVPELQARHLKRWSLAGMIHTDVTARALPWAHLVLGEGRVPNDLNLTWSQRLSGAATIAAGCAYGAASMSRPASGWLVPFVVAWLLVSDATVDSARRSRDPARGVAASTLLVGCWAILGRAWSDAMALALGFVALEVVLNLRWYQFLVRERGLAFAVSTAPLLLLYHAYSTLAFAYVWLGLRLGPSPGPNVEPGRPRPLAE